MTANDKLMQEYKEINRLMKQFSAADNLPARNELVPRLLELEQQIDWGYAVGEEVERRTGRGWEADVIRGISGNEFRFRAVVLPHQMIRKKEPDASAETG